jgi:hypothetical protein
MDAALNAILDSVWRELQRAPADPGHPWRTPALATVDSGTPPKDEPDVRIVVLRRCEPDHPRLTAWTDLRAPKVRQLRAEPRAVWLFYDPAARIQVRAYAACRILSAGPIWEREWEVCPPLNRSSYLGPYAPGTRLASCDPNRPEEFRSRPPTREESERGRTQFGVIAAQVLRLDWLRLDERGHQRARFAWTNPGEPARADWIAP